MFPIPGTQKTHVGVVLVQMMDSVSTRWTASIVCVMMSGRDPDARKEVSSQNIVCIKIIFSVQIQVTTSEGVCLQWIQRGARRCPLNPPHT